MRQKLDALPDEQRSVLLAFANQVEQDHYRMKKCSEEFDDMVGDLNLTIKTMRFNIWACVQDTKSIQQSQNLTSEFNG
jgi:hypothetical protein